MALPNDVFESDILEPQARTLQVRLEFAIEGEAAPGTYAYFSGDVGEIERGLVEEFDRAEVTHPSAPAPGGDDFYNRAVKAQTNEDFFVRLTRGPGMGIEFSWSDLASFMWFEPFQETELKLEEPLGDDFFSGGKSMELS